MPGEITASPTAPDVQTPPAVDALPLHIVVMEGNGAVNILSRKTATQPVVQVLNKNDQPVAGAVVTFTSPNNAPGATFLNDSRSMTVITDSNGKAALVGMTPVGAGAFRLTISATFRGQTAITTVSQTNYETVADATAAGAPGYGAPSTTGANPAGLSNKAKGGIIAGVAAAAVIGVVVGLSGHGASTNSAGAAAIPTASISLAGTPSPGAPH